MAAGNFLNDEPLIATADGKTACQGHGADGKPIHMLVQTAELVPESMEPGVPNALEDATFI